MIEDRFFDLIDPVLQNLGSLPHDGEEFRDPPLDVLRYFSRPARLHWAPYVGRGVGVVAVVRQPVDLGFSVEGCRALLGRLALAVNGRFPPRWSNGLALGLTTIVLTPEPIGPDDENVLARVLDGRALPRSRAVPLGLLRLNLGQEALAFALASGPPGAFPEPVALADLLSEHFRRFVRFLEV